MWRVPLEPGTFRPDCHVTHWRPLVDLLLNLCTYIKAAHFNMSSEHKQAFKVSPMLVLVYELIGNMLLKLAG